MIEKLIRDINQSSMVGEVTVGLITHKGPDYDAVASTLGLANYLNIATNSHVRVLPILEKNSFHLKSDALYVIGTDESLDYIVVLDVNEMDRVYGVEYLNQVEKDKRYLFDHHTGNRVPILVDEDKCMIDSTASSTSEIIGREILKRGTLSEKIATMLYYGMVSDTVGFKRQTTDKTLELCKKLNIKKEVKKEIFDKVTGLSEEQKRILSRIERLNCDVPGLTLYSLREDETFLEKMSLLKHEKFDDKIIPAEGMSILVIDCGSSVHLKIRKSKDSDIDIVEFAEKCNGGGHKNRTSGRFYDKSYDEVLVYITLLYELMVLNKNDSGKVLRKGFQDSVS